MNCVEGVATVQRRSQRHKRQQPHGALGRRAEKNKNGFLHFQLLNPPGKNEQISSSDRLPLKPTGEKQHQVHKPNCAELGKRCGTSAFCNPPDLKMNKKTNKTEIRTVAENSEDLRPPVAMGSKALCILMFWRLVFCA